MIILHETKKPKKMRLFSKKRWLALIASGLLIIIMSLEGAVVAEEAAADADQEEIAFGDAATGTGTNKQGSNDMVEIDDDDDDAQDQDQDQDQDPNEASRLATSISPAQHTADSSGGRRAGKASKSAPPDAYHLLQQQLQRAREPVINQTYADAFHSWIQVKSSKLHSLSMNYSGFHLLNETYNVQLRKDAKFAWINFTEMIMNISHSISQVLYNKTLIVKSLSDQVESSFNSYANDSDRVIDSTEHVYYDAKSPKTFCDVAESYQQRIASKNAAKYGVSKATSAAAAAATKATETTSVGATRRDTTRVRRGLDSTTSIVSSHFFFTLSQPNFTLVEDLDEEEFNLDEKQNHAKIYAGLADHSETVRVGHRQQKADKKVSMLKDASSG